MHVVLTTLKALSFKLGITGIGFQSAGIGRPCSWDRSPAGGLVVLFVGVGFFNGTTGAMAAEISIPFTGVQILSGGASGVASEVWVQSAGGGPTFCVTGCTANISGVLSGFSGTTTFSRTLLVLLQVRQSPSSFLMSDAQEQHLSVKHGMMTDGICIDNGWAWHLDIYDE